MYSGVVVTIGAEADQRRRLNDSMCLQVINGANESKLLVADRIRNRLVEWCVYEVCNLAEAGFKIIGGQGAPVRDYWRNKKFGRPITSRSDWLRIAATPPSVPAILMPVRLPNTSSLFKNLRKVDSGDQRIASMHVLTIPRTMFDCENHMLDSDDDIVYREDNILNSAN